MVTVRTRLLPMLALLVAAMPGFVVLFALASPGHAAELLMYEEQG